MTIAIAGGGIGGLVAAIALARRGFDVEVLEQQAEPRELGAGISVFANGARVLSSLGLDEALEPLCSYSTGVQIRSGRSGRLVAELRLGAFHETRFGAKAYTLHRGDLLRVLLETARGTPSVRIQLGQRVSALSQGADAVIVETELGARLNAEVLIGADGIHSVVRREAVGADTPRFSGEVVWRALVSSHGLKAAQTDHHVLWNGRDRHFLQFPIRRGELLNLGGFVRSDRWQSESWTAPGSRQDFADLFADFHPAVRELIDRADDCFVQAIHERDPLPHWWSGRVVLLGDAAHAMPPHMGQGAGMAIEDALVLARALADSRGDSSGAFQRYEAKRKARVDRVAGDVRDNARMFRVSHPAQRVAVNAGLWLMSKLRPTASQERFSWVYEYDALSA
jgi:salicylate hydroxylase